jgi:phosphatidylglycerol:prolipoprotein diacylglycerol transferase
MILKPLPGLTYALIMLTAIVTAVVLRRRHPTQLYEAAFHFVTAAVLAILQNSGLFRGQLIKLYFISYFVYRFLTEFIRPEARLWLHLTGYQWAALAFIPLFVALWIHDAQSLRPPSADGTIRVG